MSKDEKPKVLEQLVNPYAPPGITAEDLRGSLARSNGLRSFYTASTVVAMFIPPTAYFTALTAAIIERYDIPKAIFENFNSLSILSGIIVIGCVLMTGRYESKVKELTYKLSEQKYYLNTNL